MKQSVPKSVDEYIAAQPEAVRPKLEQVRTAIRTAVPEAVEGIGYRMPGYKLYGKPMLYFAGFKEHYSLFAASRSEEHTSELQSLRQLVCRLLLEKNFREGRLRVRQYQAPHEELDRAQGLVV